MEPEKDRDLAKKAVAQKAFIPMFVILLTIDYLVQLIFIEHLTELYHLAAIWNSVGSALYGIAGLQALYYLLDPWGLSRSGKTMGTTATITSVGKILLDRLRIERFLAPSFFAGSFKVMSFLSWLGIILLAVNWVIKDSSAMLAAFFLVRDNIFSLVPIALLGGVSLTYLTPHCPRPRWWLALGWTVLVSLTLMLWDGRWHNHFHHLLNGVFCLRTWGSSLSWVGAFAALPWPSNSFSVPVFFQTSDGSKD